MKNLTLFLLRANRLEIKRLDCYFSKQDSQTQYSQTSGVISNSQAINYLGTFKLSTLSLTVDGSTAAYF